MELENHLKQDCRMGTFGDCVKQNVLRIEWQEHLRNCEQCYLSIPIDSKTCLLECGDNENFSTVQKLFDHLSGSCEKWKRRCNNSGCSVVENFESISFHETEQCLYRKIKCWRCQSCIPFNRMQDHYSECQMHHLITEFIGDESMEQKQSEEPVTFPEIPMCRNVISEGNRADEQKELPEQPRSKRRNRELVISEYSDDDSREQIRMSACICGTLC